MTQRSCSIALAAILTAACVHSAQARQSNLARTPEQMVLRSLNACWDMNDGRDQTTTASAQGMSLMPGARHAYFYRDVGGAVVTLGADFAPNARGEAEPACRITVLKPNLDTPWTPRGSALAGAADVVEGMIAAAGGWSPPYRVVYRRQPHPSRPGRTRTLLRQETGSVVKILYIEDGRDAFELLWAAGSARAMDAPGLTDLGTAPEGRVAAQAFVNDRWEQAFCDLNPHACSTPAERAAQARASAAPNTNPTLPFSGIGSSGGDNRSHEQRLRDESWWRNYHATGRGRYD